MKINLKGAVRNFTLGKGQKLSPLIAIYEAIVNSIQSNSTNINLKIERNEDLTGVKNEINKIEIQDNGEGFTKDNIESFLTLNSEHKISQGCKGVGRLAFLKIFKNIKIESSIKAENIKRTFDFNYDFSILETKEEAENDMFNFLSWEEIRKKILEELFTIFKIELPEIENRNKEVKEKIQNNYPHLLRYVNFDKYGFLNYNDLIDEAKKTIENKRKNLDKFFNNFDKSKIEENITLAEEIIAGDLSSYIIARQRLIELIELFEKYGNDKEKDEGKIHNAILQKGKEGTDFSPIPLRENNLWLLDDKFMSYNYVASDKQISTFLKSCQLGESKSKDEPDIAIYSNKKKDIKKVILIEFKNFKSGYKEGGTGISQLKNYSIQLREKGVEEVYCYLIANVDDKFKKNLVEYDGFTKVFSQEGEVYQISYGKANTFLQIISPIALIADAKARNKTFIDIIKETCKID